MYKKTFQGSEGKINIRAFIFLGVKWIVAKSETKWHRGKDYTRTPVWFSSIGEDVPCIFIGKTAIGFQRKK